MSEVRREADGLLVRYDLLKPPVDPEYIAEREGVDVKFVTFNPDAADKLYGFYDHAASTIYVNSQDSVPEKLFTIAHELGHHILHQEYSAGERYVPRLKAHVESLEETEADHFADNLLAPPSVVKQYASIFDDVELSSLFLVSPEVIDRAKDSGE